MYLPPILLLVKSNKQIYPQSITQTHHISTTVAYIHSKMDKTAKNTLVRSPGENGGGQDAPKDLHPRTGKDKTKGKTQERMERGSRKRSSSAGSEKMERVGDKEGKMEGCCSTAQSPQWAVLPMEEEVAYIPMT